MGRIVKVDDALCLELRNQLSAWSERLPSMLAGERTEILMLVAGLTMMYHFAAGVPAPPRGQLNYVLRSALGTGHSWYSCMHFLSGERARTVYVARQEFFREIGGASLMRFANHVLPDMQRDFHKIFSALPDEQVENAPQGNSDAII